MKRFLQILPLAFLLLTACKNTAQIKSELPVDAFEKALQARQPQLLDCRTAGEYRSGHLQGALQADWTNIQQFAERTAHLEKNKPVYVYCLSGGRSAAAAEYLRKQGFTEVVNMQGGINAWKRSGRDLIVEEAGKAQTTRAAYDALAAAAPTVIMDFGASWCPPCKKMEPILEAFLKGKSETVVKLVKMDGGSETALMNTLGVEGLPTFILYKNGQEVKRLQGVMSAEELDKWVGLKD